MSVVNTPILSEIIERHYDYYSMWDEKALGLFLWRYWQSLINDSDRRRFEEDLDKIINDEELKKKKKIRNAAKIAKKLIEDEKRALGKGGH